MKVTGINHLGLEVCDLERSRGFYRDVLGMRELADEEGVRVFLLAGTDVLTLEAASGVTPPEGVHFGFLVQSPQEIAQWKYVLRAHGVALDAEKRVERGWSIYFHDPDGYKIEILHVDL